MKPTQSNRIFSTKKKKIYIYILIDTDFNGFVFGGIYGKPENIKEFENYI